MECLAKLETVQFNKQGEWRAKDTANFKNERVVDFMYARRHRRNGVDGAYKIGRKMKQNYQLYIRCGGMYVMYVRTAERTNKAYHPKQISDRTIKRLYVMSFSTFNYFYFH